MKYKIWIWIGLSVVVLAAAGFGIWKFYKPQAAPSCFEVIVHADANYSVTSVCLVPGDYTMGSLVLKGIANDSISSIEISSGSKATVYQNDNFGGYSKEFTSNVANLADVSMGYVGVTQLSWDDQISSIKVPRTSPTMFTDVPTTYWAYKEIEAIAQAGYMIESGDGTFNPEEISTRTTIAVTIARAVAGSDAAVPAGPDTPYYSDVSKVNTAYRYIEYLKAKNIMTGFNTTPPTFQPLTVIDRTKVAEVLARAKNLDYSAITTSSFVDVPTTHIHFQEIEAAYKAGYLARYDQGCSQTNGPNFCPDKESTRAELAVFTYNAYIAVVPTVVTNDATAIGDTTATLNGNVTAVGSSDIIGGGFELSTNSDFTNPTLTGGGVLNSTLIIVSLTDLTAGTQYWFRAHAFNYSAGTGYGEIKTFTTTGTPPPLIGDLNNDGKVDISDFAILVANWRP